MSWQPGNTLKVHGVKVLKPELGDALKGVAIRNPDADIIMTAFTNICNIYRRRLGTCRVENVTSSENVSSCRSLAPHYYSIAKNDFLVSFWATAFLF